MKAFLNALWMSAVFLTLFGCGRNESADQHQREANTPAGKVGQVAYGAAKVTGKAAKAAGKELSKAAHEAHEGWKEASEKDKGKH